MIDMEVNTLEETLCGGYAGLYGEVVTCDMYRLKQVKFQPDIIFDVGANVGVFSRYARTLFPKALIVALEPHPENLFYFRKFTNDPNLVLVPKALGTGMIYRCSGAPNGAGESYLCSGLGFSILKEVSDRLTATTIPAITLGELVHDYWRVGMKAILKVDCEGAENSIWMDALSMSFLPLMDYLCMELHDYSLTNEGCGEVKSITVAALKLLEATHTCERDGVYFWATKKEL
jgi:FkbM family methyltransferase